MLATKQALERKMKYRVYEYYTGIGLIYKKTVDTYEAIPAGSIYDEVKPC